MADKKVIAVLFGGQSSEHDISCISARTVAGAIDTSVWNVLLVGITREGRWLLAPSLASMEDGTWRESEVSAVLSPDANDHGLYVTENGQTRTVWVDTVFPVLHGLYGEDGTVQGILELARIPYVGCGVLASSVSMDKAYTKLVVQDALEAIGVRQARYLAFRREETDPEAAADAVEKAFAYPVFIKPCNAGSSKGVTRAQDRASLLAGLEEAFRHDRKLLVEETIVGHEVECAVLGGHSGVSASGVGEILAAEDAAFYDFDAKYYNAASQTVTDPVLPGGATEKIREAALAVFRAVDGFGLARVDFFCEKDGSVVFNEINTMPGFTAISMYPQLWAARGVKLTDLVARLIALAEER